MIYAGKSHRQLAGSDLVLTHATNTFNFLECLTDNSRYFPNFVCLTRCQ